MNTREIESHLGDLKRFRGVYASNRTPSLRPEKLPQAIVSNLDPDNMPGSHWVASVVFVKNGKKIIELFDSYGMKPPPLSRGKNWRVIHNPHRFQKLKSKVCGQYCVYFIRERLQGGKSFEKILHFLKAQKNTDNFVKKYVSSLEKGCRMKGCSRSRLCQRCLSAHNVLYCCLEKSQGQT